MARVPRPRYPGYWPLFILLVIISIHELPKCEASIIFRSFGLAVSKGSRPRNRVISEVTSVTTVFDEFGSLPQVKYAYQAIARSRRIAVFRRCNSTVVAYTLTSGDSLQQSMGCKPLYMLGSSTDSCQAIHHLLLTGIAGDCRTVVRHMKQVVLNHTMEFETSPTGAYLAAKLGSLLQSHTSGGGRLLASHCFLISTPRGVDSHCSNGSTIATADTVSEGPIYEVSATGSVSQVRGGTAGGKHMQRARLLLEDKYTADLSVNTSKALLFEVFNATSDALSSDDEAKEGVDNQDSVLFHYVEIPDVV